MCPKKCLETNKNRHTHRSCLISDPIHNTCKTLFFCAEAICAADCTCCVLMSGTGFVAPADLPLSDDEDEQATDALA